MDDQYTFENKTYKDTYRHTTSHILAQAMKRLYLASGPCTVSCTNGGIFARISYEIMLDRG